MSWEFRTISQDTLDPDELRANCVREMSDAGSELSTITVLKQVDNYEIIFFPHVSPLYVLLGVPNYFVRNTITGKFEFANNDMDYIEQYIASSVEDKPEANVPPPVVSH